MSDMLSVSESFYSLQGEGRYAGRPAVFLRLSGCVLGCQFCDTTEVWKHGVLRHIKDSPLTDFFEERAIEALRNFAHLVITGGEPLIHQRLLPAFLERLHSELRLPRRLFIEVETAGVLAPTEAFRPCVTQWNVSPKLANSGEPLDQRIKLSLLRQLNSFGADFKFVVSTVEDVQEAVELINAIQVPVGRVYLMPMASTRKELEATGAMIAGIALAYGYNYSHRLQVSLWDKTTGV